MLSKGAAMRERSIFFIASVVVLAVCNKVTSNECAASCYLTCQGFVGWGDSGGEETCLKVCDAAPEAEMESEECWEFTQETVEKQAGKNLYVECACLIPSIEERFRVECAQRFEAYGSKENFRAICEDE